MSTLAAAAHAHLYRLLVHVCIAGSGIYGLVDPPPSIVAAADPRLAVAWALLLMIGGGLSMYAVLSGYLLPYIGGLGLEVVGIALYCVALWLVAERQATSVLFLLGALTMGLVDTARRLRREARRV